MIPAENHVLRYSILILSCVPAATQQLVLSEIVCPPDQKSNSDIFGGSSSCAGQGFVPNSFLLRLLPVGSVCCSCICEYDYGDLLAGAECVQLLPARITLRPMLLPSLLITESPMVGNPDCKKLARP
jgi:hypothetical protein